MHQLTPCTACGRHVRRSETVCPFCRAEATATPAKRTEHPPRGLSRGALMAWGAALSMAAACGGGGNAAPPYGTPPPDDYETAGDEEVAEPLETDTEADPGIDDGAGDGAEPVPEESPPVAIYGGPPAPD